MWQLLLSGFIVGFIVGYFLGKKKERMYDGTFVIDNKYDDKKVWFLNVDSDVEEIPKKRSLRFRVEVKD